LKLDSSELLRPSLIALLAANLFPIYGVVFLGWEVFPLLLLFWLENLIIGVFNVLKMISVTPNNAASWLVKLFMIPFFCFHYGMFTLVHGVFVFGLFGGYFQKGASFPDGMVPFQVVRYYQLEWAVLALLLSHGISFGLNYIGKSEYRRTSLAKLMEQPYARVVLLHMTILFGGFLVMAMNSPVAGLLLLTVLKIILDVRSHLREHPRASTSQSKSGSI
jgi:hypothetical protein